MQTVFLAKFLEMVQSNSQYETQHVRWFMFVTIGRDFYWSISQINKNNKDQENHLNA